MWILVSVNMKILESFVCYTCGDAPLYHMKSKVMLPKDVLLN